MSLMHQTAEKTALTSDSRIERFIYPLLIVVVCLIYSSIYFFNTYPVSEGWNVFNAELIMQKKVPYRDFYYYLPPLNLIIDMIFWKLSFGKLLIYRGWYLVQRIFILLLMYKLLSKHFDRPVAFFSLVIASIVMTACVYDLFGDYNQTTVFLSVCLLYPMSKFAGTAQYRNKRQYLFYSGIIIGLMLLNKQTIFIATGIVCFIALFAYCIKEKDFHFVAYCISTAIGLAIPLASVFIYLLSHHALFPFVQQVFLYTDGKGSLLNIVIRNLFLSLRPAAIPTFLIITIFYVINNHSWTEKIKRYFTKFLNWFRNRPPFQRFIIGALTLYVLFVGIAITGFSVFNSIITPITASISSNDLITRIICFAVLVLISGWYLAEYTLHTGNKRVFSVYIIIIFLISLVIAFTANYQKSYLLVSLYFSNIQKFFLPFVQMISIVLCIYFYRSRHYVLFIFFAGSFALYYSLSMSAGYSLIMPTAITISFPLLIAYSLSDDFFWKKTRPLCFSVTCCICAIVMVFCFLQKRTCPYEWWGYKNEVIEQQTYPISIPALTGIRVTSQEQEMFEEINHLIESNTDSTNEVWGYPYIKLFNILSNRYNMNTFVPILFPDVVSDRYVEQATALIQQHNPTIVLWKNIPNCLTTHEYVFRNRHPLKQRYLERLFAKFIPERYTILGFYNDIEVYRLKDDSTSVTYGNNANIIQVESVEENGIYIFTLTNPLTFVTPVHLRFKIDPKTEFSCAYLYHSRRSIDSIDINELIDDCILNLHVNLKCGETKLLLCCKTEHNNDKTRQIEFIDAVCES